MYVTPSLLQPASTPKVDLLQSIGATPLVAIDGVFVKLECSNPGGSVKDRIAKYILLQARQRGWLAPNDTIVEATSGNTGIALAMVAREIGHRVIIWMPEHMSEERVRMLKALGADVRLTPENEGFEGPIARRDSYKGRDGYYVPDQFSNPDNVRCHQYTTGSELIHQLRENGVDQLDAFVAVVGTGGTLMGVGKALRDVMLDVHIIAVEPAESAVMAGGKPGNHSIQGIGDGFVPGLIDMAFVDDVITVTSAAAQAESRSIHDRFGYCVGISAGANNLAARRLREDGLTVATLWPDCSDRYVSMGLDPPGVADGGCPHRGRCASRWQEVIER